MGGMTARLLDGRQLAATLKKDIHQAVEDMQARGLRRPGLAAILVGRDAASEIYVRNKRKSTEEVGMRSIHHGLDASTPERELLELRLQALPSPLAEEVCLLRLLRC